MALAGGCIPYCIAGGVEHRMVGKVIFQHCGMNHNPDIVHSSRHIVRKSVGWQQSKMLLALFPFITFFLSSR